MIYVSLLTIILLATATFAAPPSSSHSRRRRRSQPLRRIETKVSSESSNQEYSPNWAGSVWESYPPVRVFISYHIAGFTSVSQGTFTTVAGTFDVPTPSSPDGSASAWVGIDGATCRNAILQTGINFTYDKGNVSYQGGLTLF